MSVPLLKGAEPPIADVKKLGRSALSIYKFLWEHTKMEQCSRIYNTSNWTIKGMADQVCMARVTAASALDKLLDHGFIGIAGKTDRESIVWAVYHPQWVEHVQHSLEIMGELPSARLKKMRSRAKKVTINPYEETEW